MWGPVVAMTQTHSASKSATGKRALRWDPSEEDVQFDEGQTNAELAATMRGIQETTFEDYGHAHRSVHAKSHGLLEGQLTVLSGLTPMLAQGLFAQPGTFPVIMRFSTNPGDILDDTVSTPRGLAIKIIGVKGERLPGSEGRVTQDFVMVNGPTFGAPDSKAFLGTLKKLAATTDTGQGWKKALSVALRGTVSALGAFGIESGTLKQLGGHPMTHPLGETYFAQTPFRYGDYVAKFSVAPVSSNLIALTDRSVNLSGKPNGLREAMIEALRHEDAEWEFRVQLRTSDDMPIEDASSEWPQKESPFIAVARIKVQAQPAWSEARAQQVDDAMSFSPWHGLAAHQPLGSVNRARKMAYTKAKEFRASRNRCPIHEPHQALKLSLRPAQVFGTTAGREGMRSARPKLRKPASSLGGEVGRHALAGAAGGLLAGTVVSAMLLRSEATTGRGSELIDLQRRTARKFGRGYAGQWSRPSVREEVAAHGGHLALSAIAGAAYSLTTRDSRSPIAAGLLFGAGFYVLAYGIAGPALGVTPSLRKTKPADIVQHGLLHAVFGVVTAYGARKIAQRL